MENRECEFYARGDRYGSFIADLEEALEQGDLALLASDLGKLRRYHEKVRQAKRQLTSTEA